MLTNTLSQDGVTQAERRRAEDLKRRGIREGTPEAAAGDRGSSGSVASTPSLPHADVTFRSDPAAERRDTANFLAAIKQVDGTAGTQLESFFQQHPPSAVARVYGAKYRLSINNVVDVATMYLGASWFVSRGSEADPTGAQMCGLHTQLAGAFARTPAFARLTNAEKQSLADSMILEAVTDAVMLDSARGKPDSLRVVAANATEGARNRIHFDVSRYNFTNQGFVAR